MQIMSTCLSVRMFYRPEYQNDFDICQTNLSSVSISCTLIYPNSCSPNRNSLHFTNKCRSIRSGTWNKIHLSFELIKPLYRHCSRHYLVLSDEYHFSCSEDTDVKFPLHTWKSRKSGCLEIACLVDDVIILGIFKTSNNSNNNNLYS